MRCQVTPALKGMIYSWYKNEELLQKNQQTIIFESFTRADLGVYKCSATGKDERNLQVTLEAKSYQMLSIFVPIKVGMSNIFYFITNFYYQFLYRTD